MKKINLYPLFVGLVVVDIIWIAVTVYIFHLQGRL